MNRVLIAACTLCAIVFVSVYADTCDDANCPSFGLTHYRELGCTPIKGANGCCAERYECPNLELRRANPKKCYYKGKTYGTREHVPMDLTEPVCQAGCFCDTERSDLGRFTCAQMECADVFGHRPQPGCHFYYETKACCAAKEYCPEKERAAGAEVKTCTHDGKEYFEGQRVYKECEKCVCKSGQLDCIPLDCSIELRIAHELTEGAAPIYYGRKKCGCPIGTAYGSEKMEIIPSGSTSVHKCKMGNQELNVGDVVKPEYQNECVKCKCEVPPIVTCIQDPNCTY